MTEEELEQRDEEAARRYLAARRHLAERMDDECISFLEARFETGICCFQGRAGGYDPLDAMRRDAHREVILYLKSIRQQHEND